MQSCHTEILFGPLSSFGALFPRNRTIFVTSEALKERATTFLAEGGENTRWIEVPDSESCKTFPVLDSVYHRLLTYDAGPDTLLCAIGGGSVSDLSGLVAHTWKRGVELVIVPTTLLSMIDASIGGKNAIDMGKAKNVVGSFHLPSHILCDMRWLSSLSERDLASGMAEAIKHAVLDGDEHVCFFEHIAAHRAPLSSLDAATFERLIRQSQAVKLRYVQADPRDAMARHALNYGHTFGHAIELLTGLPHGFAVAAGIGAANTLAVSRKTLAPAVAARIASLLRHFGLPANIQEAFDMAQKRLDREALLALLSSDKKRRGNQIDFVLPHGIGDVRVEPIPMSELAEVLRK